MTKQRLVILLCFISYISLLFYLLFLSSYRTSVQGQIAYNIIPFKTISSYLHHFGGIRVSMITDNFFGNIAAFLPFGFLLPLLREGLSFSKIILYSFLFSLCIEITQFVFRVGAFDVDDMILNTAGGTLGYSVFLLFNLMKRGRK